MCLQCLDTAGWASGRASGLLKFTDEVLVWLSVWREVQIVCTWSIWCHCIPKPHYLLPHFKSRQVLPFWYRLTQVVLEKRPLSGCSGVVVANAVQQQTWRAWLHRSTSCQWRWRAVGRVPQWVDWSVARSQSWVPRGAAASHPGSRTDTPPPAITSPASHHYHYIQQKTTVSCH